MHLLDANVLIRAHEDYYPIDRVPQFWEWLVAIGNDGQAKMPFEIYHEISIARGMLADWIKETHVKDALLFEEEANQSFVQHVLDHGYARGLTDDEIEKVGRDPFLVAYSLVDAGRSVVTKEVSRPSKQRANRKVPDVCDSVGVSWMSDFEFFKTLGFTTK